MLAAILGGAVMAAVVGFVWFNQRAYAKLQKTMDQEGWDHPHDLGKS